MFTCKNVGVMPLWVHFYFWCIFGEMLMKQKWQMFRCTRSFNRVSVFKIKVDLPIDLLLLLLLLIDIHQSIGVKTYSFLCLLCKKKEELYLSLSMNPKPTKGIKGPLAPRINSDIIYVHLCPGDLFVCSRINAQMHSSFSGPCDYEAS